MTETEIQNIIQQQLPELIKNPSLRDMILRTVSEYYAPKQETESKFDRILAELQLDREEQARKWDENNQKWDENNRRLDEFIHQQNLKWDEQNSKWEEQNRKWDENNRRLDEIIHQQNLKWDEQNSKWEEQNRKWDENNRRLDEIIHQQNLKWEENNRKWEENNQEIKTMQKHIGNNIEDLRKLSKTYNSTIGALGARWGLYSEASFRNGLKAILEDSFGVEVLNVNEFDDEGDVFGRPDQVEIDVIIKNGLLILCEIKSSIDKAGMYIFDRKVTFYEKRHQRKANRKMVICPMVDDRAKPVATKLGIELCSHNDIVELSFD